MTQKLALYFLSQGDTPRILEADHQPVHSGRDGWLLGRAVTSDVCFRVSQNPDYDKVSKEHALIVATLQRDTTQGGNPIYRWDIIDLSSANGTYIGDPPSQYRCSPGTPYALGDRTLLQLGAPAARLRASFDIDDTHDCNDDDPPTGKKTIIDSEREKRGSHSPWFVPDILDPVWVWFLTKNSAEQFVFLLAIGGVAAVILYVLRL